MTSWLDCATDRLADVRDIAQGMSQKDRWEGPGFGSTPLGVGLGVLKGKDT